MAVADGLAPVWRQGICNHSVAVGRSSHIWNDTDNTADTVVELRSDFELIKDTPNLPPRASYEVSFVST